MDDKDRSLCLQLALYCQLAPEDCIAGAGHAQHALARARETLRETAPDTGHLLALLDTVSPRDLAPDFAGLLHRCMDWCETPGHSILTLADKDYPSLLRQIPDPPPALFLRSEKPHCLDLPQIAIVGSRKPSADGRRLATRLARELGEAGYTTTSGLALGIDGAAHEGALQESAGTVAVLGSGLDEVYPRRHRALAAAITGNGALVSEFWPGTPARAWQFPRRNRVISGLAHGVLVVEAACASGSLITAGMGAAQGRTVFAVPGAIHNPQVRGCHALLRQGAVLVESIDDILAELGAMVDLARQTHTSPARPATPAGREHASLLAQIAYNPVTADSLAASLQRKVEVLYPQLLQLELEGLIEHTATGYVRRC